MLAVKSAYSACSAREWSGTRRAFQIRVQSPTTLPKRFQAATGPFFLHQHQQPTSFHHGAHVSEDRAGLHASLAETACSRTSSHFSPQARLVCRRRSRSTRNGLDDSLCATSTTSHPKSRCMNSSSHARQPRADCMAESLVLRYAREPSYIARTKVTKLIHK